MCLSVRKTCLRTLPCHCFVKHVFFGEKFCVRTDAEEELALVEWVNACAVVAHAFPSFPVSDNVPHHRH